MKSNVYKGYQKVDSWS